MADLAQEALNAWNNVQMLQRGLQSLQGAQGVSAEQMSGQRAAIDRAYVQLEAANRARDAAAGGGGNTNTDVDPYAFEREQLRLAEEKRQKNAIAALSALMTEYGLDSLMGKIKSYVKDGYDADAVMALIRTTPEYKERFPAMEALAKKGRAISEAAYIDFERTASGMERQYGLPSGMLMGNVTTLLENEVSAAELNDRVLLAAASAYQAPQEVRDTFKEYYNIDSGGLTAYFLDPEVATPLLQKQYGAAVIGSEASRQSVQIESGLAEQLVNMGISQEQARSGFGEVARRSSLTAGRGDVVTQQQLIGGELMGNEEAQAQIRRASAARAGRFQQGGQALTARAGVMGAGSAATR